MAPSDGWYLVGPLLAVSLVTLVAAVLRRTVERDPDQLCELCTDGLAILCGQGTDDPVTNDTTLGESAAEEAANGTAANETAIDETAGSETDANGTDTDEGDDYGLLRAAALTDDPALATDIRRLLVDAGIRATYAVRRDRQLVVLVFDEQVEQARRLVDDSPVL